MEPDFVKATCENLPEVNYVMIHEFFVKNGDYFSTEIKGVKNIRASRAGYGDDAIGYVQIKRENNICIIKGKICPEHKVNKKEYRVAVTVDESADSISSCQCYDCAAAQGGCKHAIAFLYWILRRNDDTSPTSTDCYWTKPKLSKVGSSIKFIKAIDLKEASSNTENIDIGNFVEKVVSEAHIHNSSAQILKYFSPPTAVKQLSIHYLIIKFDEINRNGTPEEFLKFCQTNMNDHNCKEVHKITALQSKDSLWYELRYGRITASRIFEVSRCKTPDGSLVENILGASSMSATDAMRRGLALESEVLLVVSEQKKMSFKKIGLVLSRDYPIFGASPDAINEEYVVEIKCPSRNQTIKKYLSPNGTITLKYFCQIYLQMLFCNKKKGLFCVADPKFEENKKVQVIEVNFNEGFIKVVIETASKFWMSHIFPILRN